MTTRKVFQIDLQNDISWNKLFPDPILFEKLLMFESNELGDSTQFSTFDNKRAILHTTKQPQSFLNNIFYASIFGTVLKKLTRAIFKRSKTVGNSKPRNLYRHLSLTNRILLDHFLRPSSFRANFKVTFSELRFLFNVRELLCLFPLSKVFI